MSYEPGTSDVVDQFIEALRAVGRPPCDGCKDEFPCADNETACASFKAYIDGEPYDGLDRVPSHRLYASIYPTERQKSQREHLRQRQIARKRRKV